MNTPAPSNVVEALVAALRTSIALGELVPGQRLLEPDLMARHAVSRGPVREALRLLAAEGLVTMVPNRGASVRRLTRQEVVDLFQIRSRLEALAASLAATKIGQGATDASLLKALKQNLAATRRYRGVHAANEYGGLNREFHGLIVQLSGNRQLEGLVGQLNLSIFSQQFRWFLDGTRQDESIQDHLKIAEALLAGDSRASGTLMSRHVERGAALALALPDACFA